MSWRGDTQRSAGGADSTWSTQFRLAISHVRWSTASIDSRALLLHPHHDGRRPGALLLFCFACLGWGRAYLPASPRHRWPPGARAPQGPARQRQPDARCAPARAAACTHPPVAAAACFIVCSVSCTVLLCHHAHLHYRCAAQGDAVTGVWDRNEGGGYMSWGWDDREDRCREARRLGSTGGRRHAHPQHPSSAHATSLIRSRPIHSHHYSLSPRHSTFCITTPHHTTPRYIHSKEVQQPKGKEGKRSNRGEEREGPIGRAPSLFIRCIKTLCPPLRRLHPHPSVLRSRSIALFRLRSSSSFHQRKEP
jgi:hypothetical protein